MMRFIKIYALVAFCGTILISVDAQAVSRRYLQEKCNELKQQNPPKISVMYNYGVLKYNFDFNDNFFAWNEITMEQGISGYLGQINKKLLLTLQTLLLTSNFGENFY